MVFTTLAYVVKTYARVVIILMKSTVAHCSVEMMSSLFIQFLLNEVIKGTQTTIFLRGDDLHIVAYRRVDRHDAALLANATISEINRLQ